MDRSAAGHAARTSAPSFAPRDPVTVLRGVGPHSAALLRRAGIATLADLLLFVPRRHRTIVELATPEAAAVGQHVRLAGRVVGAVRRWLPGRRSLVTVTFRTSDGAEFEVPFFNQPYLKNAWQPGAERQVEGVLERSGRRFVVKGARVLSPAMAAAGPCVVHYPEVDGVSDMRLRALVHQALRCVRLGELHDELPEALASELLDLGAAVVAMHQPPSVEAHEAARRRFALLEAVRLFRRVEEARRARDARRGLVVPFGPAVDARIAAAVPFAWTDDQARAVEALRARLAGPSPIGVLLQGDVGTGKTAVAVAVAVATVCAGHQVAFLAPTELLAAQHAVALAPWFARAGIACALLTGSVGAVERRGLHAGLAAGELPVVVGTHALLSAEVSFARLGLVVVDEQHRFGVEQRMQLVRKGDAPHVLVMSATPIPRTLALTLFGDLDVLVLRERPRGRRAVRALFVPRAEWRRVVRAIARCVRRGGRCYVVCPKVGDDGEMGGAVRLRQELGRRFRTALVHGRMAAAEQEAATRAFRRGEVDVLVGTTVLEVGIDVPVARLCVVVGAERFGLATLHQLRGRVGRGEGRGLCILTGEANARTRALCASTDGFALAEEDLRLRGAGELLGTHQTGAFDFKALDPVEDLELLQRARAAVRGESR